MTNGNDRILTTHVGSLPRPHDLLVMLQEKEHNRSYDGDRLASRVRQAVAEVVHKQADAGLDVVNDGEQGKVGFSKYATERMSGLTFVEGPRAFPAPWKREIDAFPEYYEEYFKRYPENVSPQGSVVCTGAISYQGHDAIQADIDNLRHALADVDVHEAFLPSISPRVFGPDDYYHSEDDYLTAVAAAMRVEYEAILSAGFMLQIDDPSLIYQVTEDSEAGDRGQGSRAGRHVELLNEAVRGLPKERIRLHVCYGLNHGPRIYEPAFAEIVDTMLRVDVGAYSFEAANPRHQHEWRIWEDVALPEERVLIPGFLNHGTNYVEHPELIADSILKYAKVVGRERVMAGADCGFSSKATFVPEVHPTVVWEKFRALAEGAELASQRLW